MTLYDRIREKRLSLGMTQDELAHLIGYKDRSMITKIEAGTVDLSQKKVAKFSSVLGVSVSYLMGWESDDNSLREPVQKTYAVTEEEYEIIAAFRNADAGTRSSVRKLLDIPEEKDISESAIS